MATALTELSRVQDAVAAVCRNLEDQPNCRHWSELDESSLWRELVGCILGSRVPYRVALNGVALLEESGLLCPPDRGRKMLSYEREMCRALSGRGTPRSRLANYPFPRQKSRQIRLSAETIYSSGQSLRTILSTTPDVRLLRRTLSERISGIGPKQASLFLRNICFSKDLAVLDVHVLTYMRWAGLVNEPIASIPSVSRYESLEYEFVSHAHQMGFSADRFDLGVWIAVRVVKRGAES